MEPRVWLMLALRAARPAAVTPSRTASGGVAGRWMELLGAPWWELGSVEPEGEGCGSPGSAFQPGSCAGNGCCARLTRGFYKPSSPCPRSAGF